MRPLSSALVLALLGTASCGVLDGNAPAERGPRSSEPSPATRGEAGAVLERVRYELVLDTTGTTPIEGGFRFRSARGEDVEVRHATVTSLLATLSPCTRTRASAERRGASTSGLAALLLPALARAGHTELSDPSELLAPRIETFGAAPSTVAWGELRFPRSRYCGAQYVATRATTPETVGQFDRLATLHVEVHTPTRDVVVHTTIAGGKLESLESVGEEDESLPPGTAVVRIERSLGSAFRDVDFGLHGRELERAMMRGLAAATRLRVRMRSIAGANDASSARSFRSP